MLQPCSKHAHSIELLQWGTDLRTSDTPECKKPGHESQLLQRARHCQERFSLRGNRASAKLRLQREAHFLRNLMGKPAIIFPSSSHSLRIAANKSAKAKCCRHSLLRPGLAIADLSPQGSKVSRCHLLPQRGCLVFCDLEGCWQRRR